MNKLGLLRHVFSNDKFVSLAGIEIVSVDDEKAIVRAAIGPEHLNASGHVQGGMLYTLADFAFAVISNQLHPITVTQVGHVSYILPGVTKSVTAEARERVRAGHNTVCEVLVRDDADKVICVCEFNGFVKDVTFEELAAKYGYKDQ